MVKVQTYARQDARVKVQRRPSRKYLKRQKKEKREKTKRDIERRLRRFKYKFSLAKIWDPSDVLEGKWVAEHKYDGERAILQKGEFVGRRGYTMTHRYPELRPLRGVVLDGEVDVAGDFTKILKRNTDDPEKIVARAKKNPAKYYVFDMLELNGKDLSSLPFGERRKLLEKWFSKTRPEKHGYRLIKQKRIDTSSLEATKKQVEAMVEEKRKKGKEGLMLKDLSQPYKASRTRNILKAKALHERIYKIAGYKVTGVGGFLALVKSNGRLQRVTVNTKRWQTDIRTGRKKHLEVSYLSKGKDGALRFPVARKLLK